MPLTFYSMSLDAMVIRDMIEDPTLDVPMKITSNGTLFVRGQFIEATRSYVVITPIPSPVDSMSFDDFNSYAIWEDLNGLNSGSNEWANTSPLAAYVAGDNYTVPSNTDYFIEYELHTNLYPTMSGGGFGGWSGSYDYYGIGNYLSIRAIDEFEEYTVDTPISESNLGRGDQHYPAWSGSWLGSDTPYEGVMAYETYETYETGSTVSGSNDNPDPRYQFTGPWVTRDYQFTTVLAYETFETYDTGSNIIGLNDQPDSRYQKFTGGWVTRLDISGSV